MIKNGDNVILKFNTLDGELSRYKGKAYIYESMENATKYCYHNATLVEYAPVARGQWIEAEHSMNKQCSHCKMFSVNFSKKPLPYCPYCGAKMKGDEYE